MFPLILAGRMSFLLSLFFSASQTGTEGEPVTDWSNIIEVWQTFCPMSGVGCPGEWQWVVKLISSLPPLLTPVNFSDLSPY